jgi:hypothetical protein
MPPAPSSRSMRYRSAMAAANPANAPAVTSLPWPAARAARASSSTPS